MKTEKVTELVTSVDGIWEVDFIKLLEKAGLSRSEIMKVTGIKK